MECTGFSEQVLAVTLNDPIYTDVNSSVGTARKVAFAEGRVDGLTVGLPAGIETVLAKPLAYGLAPIEELTASGATPHTNGWYYQPDWGWIWTNAKTFPYVYRASKGNIKGGWLYFQSGSANPIRYYDYNTQAWIDLEESSAEQEILNSIFD